MYVFPDLFCLSFLHSLLLHHGSCLSIAQMFCLSTLGLLCHLSFGMQITILYSGWLHVLG